MDILIRVKERIKNELHKAFWSHLGYGNRVSKQVWEEQFGSADWDYLSGKDEEAHYVKIVDFYKTHNHQGKILDIGCGKGVLYSYLKKILNINESQYKGIDISKNAVQAASRQFPGVAFKQVDFDYEDIDGKFDVIIFNETLYYFNRPLKTLKKSVEQNLNPNGCFIISMCDYSNHDLILKQISKRFKTILEDEVTNNKGQTWKIKLIKQLQ